MNSVANGKVRANTPFEEVYIQPAAADNGTALGAALHLWHEELGGERTSPMNHAFWGPEYSDAEVPELLEDHGAAVERTRYGNEETLIQETAEMIASGRVVGWFQGRMEWGARALGNRSILADPRRAEARGLINDKIKYREEFRPFAPSILEEAVDEYFVDAAPDPFMQQVYPVREEKREEIPAVTHVDGTGRLQAVSRDTNPLYHRLISAFAERTGVPLVLNTSFNENEPIVCTPEEALDCFLRTDMDAVVVGREMIRKRSDEPLPGDHQEGAASVP
jgi:carbamoyltransferase